MPLLGLDHFNLRASRILLDKLKNFYCEVLGLAQGDRPPFKSFGYWLYAGNQAILHLTETKSDEPRSLGTQTTFDHIAFICTDQPAMESRLTDRNIDYKVTHVPSTGQIQIFLEDPAGNGLELNFHEKRS
jgi:extradiol dioxygenase family protein